MSERDPRREPSVGDVLRRGQWERAVTVIGNVRGYQIRYTRTHLRSGNTETRTCHTHEGWWRWAKGATVIHRADAQREEQQNA